MYKVGNYYVDDNYKIWDRHGRRVPSITRDGMMEGTSPDSIAISKAGDLTAEAFVTDAKQTIRLTYDNGKQYDIPFRHGKLIDVLVFEGHKDLFLCIHAIWEGECGWLSNPPWKKIDKPEMLTHILMGEGANWCIATLAFLMKDGDRIPYDAYYTRSPYSYKQPTPVSWYYENARPVSTH